MQKLKRKRLQTSAKESATLTLRPTPFDKEGNVKRAELLLLRHWLVSNFDDEFTIFMVAMELDVHRSVAEEWVHACHRNGLLDPGWFAGLDTYACKELDDIRHVDVQIKTMDYDPWMDRKWDTRFYIDSNHPYFIDNIADKYFSAFTDEWEMFTGEQRIRPNGKTFVPLIDGRELNDHPIHFPKGPKHWQKNGRPRPPPQERESEIDKICSRKTKRRKGTGAKAGTIKSWQNLKRAGRWDDCPENVSRFSLMPEAQLEAAAADTKPDAIDDREKAPIRIGRVRRRF